MIRNSIMRQSLLNARRKELIKAATEVFNRNGIKGFKVKDVTDLMDIGRGTLYEYIRTKNDIIFIVMEDTILKSIRYLRNHTEDIKDPLLKLKQAIHAHLQTTSSNSKILWAMYQESTPFNKSQFKKMCRLLDEYNGIFREILEEGQKKGMFKVNDPYVLAHSITTMLNTWLIKKSFLKYEFSIPDYERKIGWIILQGCLNLSKEQLEDNLDKLHNVLCENAAECPVLRTG